ncbi:hypothetical protein Sdagh_14720 [Streptomyces daghestanicus]|uniref:Uncharacterized protein n=1 Tax=Streptomyces daghestanicus TaxID=66885 RepID=A0ABQ3PXH7_9ACTN|nr:hypothetical protein Sdagh_14720 [Streptomyces daghestanicus]
MARASGGEPDAGRRLKAWALAAASPDISATSSTWTFTTAEERAWWSGLWADRTVASSYAELATGGGHASEDELAAAATAWRDWGKRPMGGSVYCTEKFCAERKPDPINPGHQYVRR